MPAVRLSTKAVEKPWGRTELPPLFSDADGRRIGEIWFDGPKGQHPPLLVKYIFTSEKLSIQVHPNDAQALGRHLPGGKSECWYILDAEPGATLGIGTVEPLSADALRAAALDGSIEALMDWKYVSAGDFFYIPAGTVHAIGPGLTLVEIQQNNDVTYRLYDYGRPRELHLEDGVAVSRAEPYTSPARCFAPHSSALLVDRTMAPFHAEMIAWEAGGEQRLPDGRSWFVPLAGEGTIDGTVWRSGECWLAEGGATIRTTAPTHALIASL